MAAPDCARARTFAADAVRDYERHGAVPEEAHHRMTNKLLQPGGPLRDHVDRFIAGEDMAQHLNTEVGKLSAIPIVERVIEARASHIRQALKRGCRKSGVRASVGLRLPEFHWNFRRPRYFAAFIDCWRRARFAKAIATELGLDDHPDVLDRFVTNCRPRTVMPKVVFNVRGSAPNV
jgi:hypothetical protein